MTKLKLRLILILSTFVILPLSGCAHELPERKAPCSPSAGLSANPCDPIPLNVAQGSKNNGASRIS
jgi:hypothetical protein